MYAKDANHLGPPILPDSKRRYAKARAMEAAQKRAPKANLFHARDYIWLPIAAILGACVLTIGTPHFLLEYRRTADLYSCSYFGLSGVQTLNQSHSCKAITALRFGQLEGAS